MDRWVLGISATKLLADFQNYLCLLHLFSKSLLTINRPPVPLKKAMAFISFHFTEQEQLIDQMKKKLVLQSIVFYSPFIRRLEISQSCSLCACFLLLLLKSVGQKLYFPFKEVNLGQLFIIYHIHMLCLKFTTNQVLLDFFFFLFPRLWQNADNKWLSTP